MKNILIIILVTTALTSCKENSLNRERTNLKKRNYVENISACSTNLGYGQIYIEFQRINRELILQKLKNFNDSIFGTPTDTMLYRTVGTPWSVSSSWISQELFVDFHNNHYGYEIFPHKPGIETQIIQHGIGNTSSESIEFENASVDYSLTICPRHKLTSKYAEYGISVSKALLTQKEIDSIYSVNFKGVHPSTYTKWIRYGIEEYIADITITLEIRHGNDEKEYYYMPIEDTIRVYNFGPRSK